MKTLDEYKRLIGYTVRKTSRKPFKSGTKVNTVAGVVVHPFLGVPSFTFVEDDSYVECRRCRSVEQQPRKILDSE